VSAAIDRLPDPILVIGAYGYRNVGDEAILAGLLAKINDRRVTVVSRDPTATGAMHGVASVAIRDAPAALRRHRSVIIGGGGLFGRDMAAIGRLLPAFGLGAMAFGRPVLVDGVDLDASLAPSARLLVPALMRRAAHVSVRDRRSVAILRAWGVRADLAPDLSAWMPIAPVADGRTLLRDAGVDTGRPVVGLALTAVEPVVAAAALAAVTGAIDALPDVQFCFLPMSRHPRVPAHDDLILARRLAALRPRLAVVEAGAHPSVVVSAFTQLSVVVSMRYHAMLFAERAGVQLVPLVYAEKNLRWLADRGLPPVPPEVAPLVAALHNALARAAPPVRSPAAVPEAAGAVPKPGNKAQPEPAPIGLAT
jgi:polysaccharide pyruvyl transferase WcaK-like protein